MSVSVISTPLLHPSLHCEIGIFLFNYLPSITPKLEAQTKLKHCLFFEWQRKIFNNSKGF